MARIDGLYCPIGLRLAQGLRNRAWLNRHSREQNGWTAVGTTRKLQRARAISRCVAIRRDSLVAINARTARRRQHVGQGARKGCSRRRAGHPLREGQRLGPGNDRRAGFAPVRLAHLQRLARLPALSDPQMVNELATQMTRASAPAPSVEAIARESYRELSLRFPRA
jgi:hypothetical protein